MRAALVPCIPHLAMNLGFPNDHRIQSARDTEEMARGGAIASHIAVLGSVTP